LRSSGYESYSRLSAPEAKDDAVLRRLVRTEVLIDRLPYPRFVRRLVFQDETDFTLSVPTNLKNNVVYSRGPKKEIPTYRLYHRGKRQSVKLMVSCGFSWNGVTKPFFVDPKLTKVNGRLYTKHLKTQLIPAIEKLYPDNNYIFVQDGASSHTSDICQEFLESKLKKSQFVASNEWPPNSPDLNPSDYYQNQECGLF